MAFAFPLVFTLLVMMFLHLFPLELLPCVISALLLSCLHDILGAPCASSDNAELAVWCGGCRGQQIWCGCDIHWPYIGGVLSGIWLPYAHNGLINSIWFQDYLYVGNVTSMYEKLNMPRGLISVKCNNQNDRRIKFLMVAYFMDPIHISFRDQWNHPWSC